MPMAATVGQLRVAKTSTSFNEIIRNNNVIMAGTKDRSFPSARHVNANARGRRRTYSETTQIINLVRIFGGDVGRRCATMARDTSDTWNFMSCCGGKIPLKEKWKKSEQRLKEQERGKDEVVEKKEISI